MALKDKMGQEIEVGMWVIRGRTWGRSTSTVEFGKVTKVSETKNWISIDGRLCKNPQLTIVVPDIVANFWSILK